MRTHQNVLTAVEKREAKTKISVLLNDKRNFTFINCKKKKKNQLIVFLLQINERIFSNKVTFSLFLTYCNM